MSKMERIRGAGPDKEKGQRFFLSFKEQWSGLNPFHPFNWRDFTLINIGGEYAKYSGRWEFECMVLGLGFQIQYVFDEAFNLECDDFLSQIQADLKARTGATTIVDPENQLAELARQLQEDEDR